MNLRRKKHFEPSDKLCYKIDNKASTRNQGPTKFSMRISERASKTSKNQHFVMLEYHNRKNQDFVHEHLQLCNLN